MPELPEVETVRRGLEKLIVKLQVRSIQVLDSPKSFPNDPTVVEQFVVGADVLAVRRRAKVLMIDLDSGYSFVVHLKMTGQLVYVKRGHDQSPRSTASRRESSWASAPDDSRAANVSQPTDHDKIVLFSAHTSHKASFRGRGDGSELISEPSGGASPSLRFGAGHPNDSLISELPDRSTRVIIEFTDGSRLYFNDQRKFGWIKVFPTLEIPNIDFMRRVGPEPLESSFTPEVLKQQLMRRKNSVIKAALLDQSVVAGIGNIYADESLWEARIHPSTRVRDIPHSSFAILHSAIVSILQLSIEKGGSTDKNYVNAEGKRGSYIDFARVFRREGHDCPRHPGTKIQKIRVAGRGTHICTLCQVLK